MSAGNAQGAARMSWDAFDKLPKSARAALANAQFDWAPTKIYRAWLNGAPGFKTGADIARRVASFDQQAHLADVKKGKVAP